MDHRQFLATLSGEQRAHLTERSDHRGLVALAVHTGAIVVTSVIILNVGPLAAPTLLVQGILLIFLFTLLHETVHWTVFRTRWINHAVARVCGILIGLPAHWFRYFHVAHHQHTQQPGKDPELASDKPDTWLDYVLHVSGIPVWWGQLKVLVNNALNRIDYDYVPDSGRGKLVREARSQLGLYGLALGLSVFFQSTMLLQLWVIPVLLGQPFLRLYLLAEHGRCPNVANMLENTRTTFTNALVRRLAWNMPYHTEHHAFPAVPFHKLPELHQLLKAHLRCTEDGYVRFSRDYASQLGAVRSAVGR